MSHTPWLTLFRKCLISLKVQPCMLFPWLVQGISKYFYIVVAQPPAYSALHFFTKSGCDEKMDPEASKHCGGKPIGLLGPVKVGKWGDHNHSSTHGSSGGPEVARRARLGGNSGDPVWTLGFAIGWKFPFESRSRAEGPSVQQRHWMPGGEIATSAEFWGKSWIWFRTETVK